MTGPTPPSAPWPPLLPPAEHPTARSAAEWLNAPPTSNVTGIALLAGIALAAQLEVVRANRIDPLLADTDDDGIPDERDEESAGSARR